MHPDIHAKSSAKQFGGTPEDYIKIHEWFDETKAWYGHSIHRVFRHHSEGIFECEKVFGSYFTNSDGKIVYTRYIGEQHVKEDWIVCLEKNERPIWMMKTMKINLED